MSSTVEQAELSVPMPWGEIRGKVWGPDHGYPVLCLHGWLDNCGTFKTLIPLLPKGGNIAGMKNLSKAMRQGMDEMLQHEKKTEEKKRVYIYEKAVERLSAANPTLSEQSVRILLERGLVQVEGGFVFSRDLRVNFKNITCISPEQSLEMQSKIQASVLVVLGDKGFAATFPESNQQLPSSKLLKAYRDRNHTVVTVSGDHHVHLNDPEAVAPLVSDFLRNKVLSQQLPA